MTQNQFDAVVSFVYNCGVGWLDSVGPLINSGDLDGATTRMKDCNTAGGQPSSTLRMRRGIEVNVFKSPGQDVQMAEL
jgi:lysozyme